MGKNVVFLIHGVGMHTDDWATKAGGAIPALSSAAQQYESLKNQKLENKIKLIPIRYDDIFDRILKGWADAADSIRTKAGAFAPSFVSDALDLLAKAGNNKNKFLTFGGDVILYHGFKLFAQRVQLRVISSMVKEIAKSTGPGQSVPSRFFVIAHSLGTAVAYDALHHLGTEEWLAEKYLFKEDKAQADKEESSSEDSFEKLKTDTGTANPLSPRRFRFDALFMVANTSRLLHSTTPDPLDLAKTIVRPGTDEQKGTYCRSYINIFHKFDPIPAIQRFKVPSTWRSNRSGFDISIDHFHQKNIHSLAHYLKHPAVHQQILFRAIPDFDITDEELNRVATFPQIGGSLGDSKVVTLKNKLSDALDEAKGKRTIKAWIEVYKTFRDAIG